MVCVGGFVHLNAGTRSVNHTVPAVCHARSGCAIGLCFIVPLLCSNSMHTCYGNPLGPLIVMDVCTGTADTEQLLCCICRALLEEVSFSPFPPASPDAFLLRSPSTPVVRPLVFGSRIRSGVFLVHVLKDEYR